MDVSGIFDLITFLIVLTFFSYISRELEIRRIISEVEFYLTLFKAARDRATQSVTRKFNEIIAKAQSRVNLNVVEEKVRDMLETFAIEPEALDPFGVVKKVKLMLRTEEVAIKDEISRVAPNADKSEVEVLTGMVEVSRGLNLLYKTINHFYIQAKKFKSYWMLLQLDALLPYIADEVKAYESAIYALTGRVPIGDSVGPLLVALLSKELKAIPIHVGVDDTIMYLADFEGRQVLLIKAEGPGSSVGRYDEALKRLLTTWGAAVTLVITVDAALKLEGEMSGGLAEGYGVAIGGTGVEKYGIEEVLTEYGLRPYALIIKMASEEALSPLSKDLYDACIKAKERVKAMILEATKYGEAVIVIGVGNTLGVGN